MAKVECPRCRGKIDVRATRCQHCQADFTTDELASIRKAEDGRRNGCIALVAIGVLVLLLGQCMSEADETNEIIDGLADSSAEVGQALADAKADAGVVDTRTSSNWVYRRRTDELRNGEIIEATIRSTNSTNLDFPYGNVHLAMTIRQHPEWGRDVIFVVDEGQILCRIRDCSGMINFDGNAERLSLNESGDNDSSVVFAAYAPAITKKLQASEKVIVELPFFQNGNRQFTFNTAGLEWPPKKAAAPPPPGAKVECDPALAKSVGLSC